VFRRFFETVVDQCQQAGLVWGKELYADATKVQANAAVSSLKPRFALEAHLDNLFAEGKQWHGMRRYRLRRLWRVNCEALIRAAGQNLKRLLKKRGWGRRPWPQGAANALLEPPSQDLISLHASLVA
jgi:hypothetical protein